MIEFESFHAMRRSGRSAESVYRIAKNLGMGDIDAIRMLRNVFGLTLSQAKEAMIVGSGTAASLDEHEARIASELAKEKFDVPSNTE